VKKEKESGKTESVVDLDLRVNTGPAIIAEIAGLAEKDGASVLSEISRSLLVSKGADWTVPILGEYLQLQPDSACLFALAWDRCSHQLVGHGAMFHSARYSHAGFIAHVRTKNEVKNLGGGSLIVKHLLHQAFDRGIKYLVLRTDDKLLSTEQGEKEMKSFYEQIGFTIVAEQKLSDTVHRLMALDSEVFQAVENDRSSDEILRLQNALRISLTRSLIGTVPSAMKMESVQAGDLSALFLLLNACPQRDFQFKLTSWDIQNGLEFERQFIVSIRPALANQDQLEDASMVLRDELGRLLAVCAARQVMPSTRQTFQIDFYCLPVFLEHNHNHVKKLVEAVITRISQAMPKHRSITLFFRGLDEAKIGVFKNLGFDETTHFVSYSLPDLGRMIEAGEYQRILNKP